MKTAVQESRRLVKVAALTGALALIAGACTGGQEVESSVGDGNSGSTAEGTLVMAEGAPPTSWNPLTPAGDKTGTRQQLWPLYPHPFLTDRDASVVVNDTLLESAEVIGDDPMVVEYKIREEAVWSDGVPITADDFIYTWQVQNPDECPDCLPAFTEGYTDITSVESLDSGLTVQMTFNEPFAMWQTLFSFILPAHVADEYGDLADSFNNGFAENPPEISGGPYILSDYQDGIAATLSANDKWYGEKGPGLDTIRYRYISSPGEQVTALQSGEVQMVYITPTLDTVEQIDSLPTIRTDVDGILTYSQINMKTVGDVLGNDDLRKAIITALDVEDMVARTVGQFIPDLEIMKSAAFIPGQIFNGVEAYRPNTDDLDIGSGNLDKAKQILDDAGYDLQAATLVDPNGEAVPPLKLLTYSVDPIRMEIARLAQNQLAELGLDLSIDAADASRYGTAVDEGQFDIVVTATALDLGVLSLAQWYRTGAARNAFGYSSESVDSLIEKASVAVDPEEYVDLMNELDKEIMRDAVVLPLFSTTRLAAYTEDYQGIEVNPSKYGVTMNIDEWSLTQNG